MIENDLEMTDSFSNIEMMLELELYNACLWCGWSLVSFKPSFHIMQGHWLARPARPEDAERAEHRESHEICRHMNVTHICANPSRLSLFWHHSVFRHLPVSFLLALQQIIQGFANGFCILAFAFEARQHSANFIQVSF